MVDPGKSELDLAIIWISTLILLGFISYTISRCSSPRPTQGLKLPTSRTTTWNTCNPKISNIALIAAFTCMWFSTSLTIVNVNRFVFGYMDHRLAFPLTITLMHMLLKGILAGFFILFSNEYSTPELLLLSSIERIRARWSRLRSLHKIGRREFFVYICPIGFVTALDVWLSNLALKSVDVSVYTTAKGTSLAWNLGLSLFFGLMSPAPKVVISVIALLAGATLASLKPIGADPLGVVFTLCAAFCSATRWVMSERLMVRRNVREAPSAFVLAAMIAPASVLTLIIPAAFEIKTMVETNALSESTDLKIFLGTIFGGGFCALFLVVSEIQLVKLTSALTISVIGYTKDLSAIILSILVFHDQLSVENWCGVLLASASMFTYSLFRSRGEGNIIKDVSSDTNTNITGTVEGGETIMPDSPSSSASSSRRNTATKGARGRERSNSSSSSFWANDNSVVDTTGFGSPNREGSGGGGRSGTMSTIVGKRHINFVHLNLDSDSEDEDDDIEDEEEDYIRRKFGNFGKSLSKSGQIKYQEKASLLNKGGEREIRIGRETNNNNLAGADKNTNRQEKEEDHHRYKDEEELDYEEEEQDNDIGSGTSSFPIHLSLSPVEGRREEDGTFVNEDEEALDRELNDAAGLSSTSLPVRDRVIKSDKTSISPTKPSSVFFGLLESTDRDGSRTLPLGKGRPHPQDRKNAAAAKALREAEARRKGITF
jgi:drug/metabolite transporter (DMT)-like permease